MVHFTLDSLMCAQLSLSRCGENWFNGNIRGQQLASMVALQDATLAHGRIWAQTDETLVLVPKIFEFSFYIDIDT